MNFHEKELEEKHTSVLYNIFNPLKAFWSRRELDEYRRCASIIQDLSGEIQRFDAARDVHEKLSILLDDKRTFFDSRPEELKEGEHVVEGSQLVELDPPKITSLDLIVWAYLKEELINTPGSKEVAYLKDKFKNLINFVKFMDGYLSEPKHFLQWNTGADIAHKIVSSL